MKIKKMVSLASVVLAIVSGSVLFTSCSCKITDEQLSKINSLRQQEKTINLGMFEINSIENYDI